VCVDCQQAVWAITAISELAVASYQEDVYGVVQRVRDSIWRQHFNWFELVEYNKKSYLKKLLGSLIHGLETFATSVRT